MRADVVGAIADQLRMYSRHAAGHKNPEKAVRVYAQNILRIVGKANPGMKAAGVRAAFRGDSVFEAMITAARDGTDADYTSGPTAGAA
jgi:hypothetical protein